MKQRAGTYPPLTPQLANPKNDAEDVATALEQLGFHVISGFDLEKSAMERLILKFSAFPARNRGVFDQRGRTHHRHVGAG